MHLRVPSDEVILQNVGSWESTKSDFFKSGEIYVIEGQTIG